MPTDFTKPILFFETDPVDGFIGLVMYLTPGYNDLGPSGSYMLILPYPGA